MVIQVKTYFKLVEFVERLIEAKFPSVNRLLDAMEHRTMIKKLSQIHGKD